MKTKQEMLSKLGSYESTEQVASNQIINHFENGRIFQSYSSVVAYYIRGEGWYFTEHHNYSSTTSKHLRREAIMDTKERQDRMSAGFEVEL